jgi:hypothetical protein
VREEIEARMALLQKGNMEATTSFETMQQRYGGPLRSAARN